MIRSGKKFSNAETNIDLEKKEVIFRYLSKNYNENLTFFSHSLYIIIGVIIGGISGYRFPHMWANRYGYELIDLNIYAQSFISIPTLFLCIIGGMILFGYISLLIHKYSKTARESFPKTNAFSNRGKTYEINLKNKISKIHKIEGKKLIIFNYSITYFKYCYIGYNKIKKIITKSVEPIEYDSKKDHCNFIAIFIFKKPIKDGYLYYKT